MRRFLLVTVAAAALTGAAMLGTVPAIAAHGSRTGHGTSGSGTTSSSSNSSSSSSNSSSNRSSSSNSNCPGQPPSGATQYMGSGGGGGPIGSQYSSQYHSGGSQTGGCGHGK
jgi:hypothetical protein